MIKALKNSSLFCYYLPLQSCNFVLMLTRKEGKILGDKKNIRNLHRKQTNEQTHRNPQVLISA